MVISARGGSIGDRHASEAGWIGLGKSEEELGKETAAFMIDSFILNFVQTNLCSHNNSTYAISLCLFCPSPWKYHEFCFSRYGSYL